MALGVGNEVEVARAGGMHGTVEEIRPGQVLVRFDSGEVSWVSDAQVRKAKGNKTFSLFPAKTTSSSPPLSSIKTRQSAPPQSSMKAQSSAPPRSPYPSPVPPSPRSGPPSGSSGSARLPSTGPARPPGRGTVNPYAAPRRSAKPQRPYESTYKALLFSFEGRINRGRYWLGTLLVVVPFLTLGMALGVTSRVVEPAPAAGPIAVTPGAVASGAVTPDPGLDPLFFLLMLPLALIVAWISTALSVKRWHDHNKSGYWALTGFVPFLGALISLIALGCMRGNEGSNDYGPDPLA